MNPSHWTAAVLPSREEIASALSVIFPDGMHQRNYLVRDISASTVWVFLYVQAIEGVTENRLRPNMVTSMGNRQSSAVGLDERQVWYELMLRPGISAPADRWYSENTREPIRDETIRALVQVGAVREDIHLPPTSPRPRYQLASDFANLFTRTFGSGGFASAVADWQNRRLPAAARERIQIVRQFGLEQGQVSIQFPNGGTRVLPAGPSSNLAKAAIEELLPRFFRNPIVLAVAEGRARLRYEDSAILGSLSLQPDARLMPDLLAADLAAGPGQDSLSLIAIELVETSGAMTPDRLRQITEWLVQRDHGQTPLVAGTVFQHRHHQAARRLTHETAWSTFVWYAGEPNSISLRLAEPSDQAMASITRTPETVLREKP